MLDLRRLEALQAIATHGSVSEAAAALELSASAVSQQMAKLEAEVGQKLLMRQGRGVKLTEAGRLLASRSEQILSVVARTEAELDSHRGTVSGNLTVVGFATAIRGLVPVAAARLATEHPDLTLNVNEAEPDEGLKLVVRGDADIAVVDSWHNAPLAIPEGLLRMWLMADTADIALPADHPLADRDTIDLRDLDNEPWVSWPKGTICHDWLTVTMRNLGCEAKIAHTAMEHTSQLALVAAGLGAAAIPTLGRDPVPDSVRMVPPDTPLIREIHAVWRDEASERPAIKAALSALALHSSEG